MFVICSLELGGSQGGSSAVADDKPVRVTLEIPAARLRNLVANAEILGRDTGKPAPDPVRLIVPMLERFIATDKAFIKARRTHGPETNQRETRHPAGQSVPQGDQNAAGSKL
jgi:hypothetical protein